MKKIITLISVLLICITTFGQFPQNPTQGQTQIKQTNLGAIEAQRGLKAGQFVDTSAANAVLYMKGVAGILIYTTSDNNYWYRSADTTRWVLIATTTSNCAGTQLISGSITWSGSGLVYDATDLDYYILCSRYFANSTTLTLAVADPTNPRIDKFYADNTGNIGVITGTPSANPQEPAINPLSQLDMGFVYIPAGSTVPAGTTQTVIYNENVEWSGTSDVPSINFAYATNPYIGSLSTYIPSAPNSSYVEWQSNGIDYLFSEAQYLKFWVRLNANFTVDPLSFLDVTFEYTDVTVSQTLAVGNGDYNMDYSLINQWQLVSIPLTGITTFGASFNSVHFVINSAPTSFQLDYVYLLETATVPPVIGNYWGFQGSDVSAMVNPVLGTISDNDLTIVAGDSVGIVIPSRGITQSGDSAHKQLLWDSTTKKLYWGYQPTILADSPLVIYTDVYQRHIKADTTRRGAALATQYYADSVGGTKWSTVGNAGTTAGANFIGTTDNVGLMFKVNNVQAGYINTIRLNTSLGYQTLLNNTTGTENVALGYISMRSNTTGAANVGIGSGALLDNTTGLDNVAVGATAGVSNTTGRRNTFIGSQAAGAAATTDSSIALGFAASAASKQFAISPVINEIKATGITGASNSGYVLTTNGSGIATFQAASGGAGTVTSVATGLGLSGGTITTSGTVVLDTASSVVLSRQRAALTYLTIAAPTWTGALSSSVGTISTGGNISGNNITASGLVQVGSASLLRFGGSGVGPNIDAPASGALRFRDAAGTGPATLSLGTAAAVASAQLEVTSTTKGALLPRMTGAEAEAISSPATGLIIYCNNANGSVITSVGLWNYNGTAWVTAGAKPYQVLTGNLTQTSTGAPTFTILGNTTGVTYTTAYTGAGLYTLTANSGTPFTANKTQVYIGGNISTVGSDVYTFNTSINSTTVIGISSASLTSGFADDILTNTPIEIRIYP